MRRENKMSQEHKIVCLIIASPLLLLVWVATVCALAGLLIPNVTYTSAISCGFVWVIAIPIGLISFCAWGSNLDQS